MVSQHPAITLFLNATQLITLMTIAAPLLIYIRPKNHVHFPQISTKMVKYAFFIASVPLMFLTVVVQATTTNLVKWFDLGTMTAKMVMHSDYYSIIFAPLILFVTWNIMQFSLWYMADDPKMPLFFKYVLLFLLAMITLVTAQNYIVLFIGWESVGIMSFLLIGWYHARVRAASAAMQALLYNRAGDIGFLFTLAWLLKETNSWDFGPSLSLKLPMIVASGFIIAAASKSAQFSLHPWLISAMEAPTPISALLHSSTMVVAGVFLLLRTYPLLELNKSALTMCLCLGALTSLLAAASALKQNDMKKIIAYSTSSQLGFMMTTIGMAMPQMAFLHICTHAFFKALMFMCAGFIIHNMLGEQDIRKMGNSLRLFPITSACMTVASLALMGFPFLAGFYSKDIIIEAMLTSNINFTAILATILTTTLTSTYTLRLIFHALIKNPKTTPVPTTTEMNHLILNPMLRLASASIAAGLFIAEWAITINNPNMTIPLYIKLTALFTIMLGLFMAYHIIKDVNTPKKCPVQETWYDHIMNSTLKNPIMVNALTIALHLWDTLLLKILGPEYFKLLNKSPLSISRLSQKGLIKLYLKMLTITIMFIWMILFLISLF